jgi:hypothetical protein
MALGMAVHAEAAYGEHLQACGGRSLNCSLPCVSPDPWDRNANADVH